MFFKQSDLKVTFRIIVFFLLTVVVKIQVHAQNVTLHVSSVFIDSVKYDYGLDPVLVNGVVYHSVKSFDYGHPYVETEVFSKGKLWLHNIGYNDVELNYDIVLGELILQYHKYDGLVSRIQLTSGLIDSFQIADKKYYYIDRDDDPSGYFEVVSRVAGEMILKHSEKTREMNAYNGIYYFSESLDRYYYDDGISLRRVRRIRDFKTIFKNKHYENILKLFPARLALHNLNAEDIERILNVGPQIEY